MSDVQKQWVVFLLGGLVDVEWADTWIELCDVTEIDDLAADSAKIGDEVQQRALESLAGVVRAWTGGAS